MKAIYLKELRSYFKSTLGYVYIAMMLIIFGFYFFMYNLYSGYNDYTIALSNVTTLILFAMPVLTMRLFAEEQKAKTDQMLYTAPVSTTKVVLGKYLAAVTVFTITIVLTMSQPITMKFLGATLPLAKVIGAYIGIYLMGISFIAVGMFISSCTDNPIVALVISIAVFLIVFTADGIGNILPATTTFQVGCCIAVLAILVFYLYRTVRDVYLSGIVGIVGLAALIALFFLKPAVYNNLVANVLNWLSITERYAQFYTGIFKFSHIFYYVSISILFAFMSIQQVEKRRWN